MYSCCQQAYTTSAKHNVMINVHQCVGCISAMHREACGILSTLQAGVYPAQEAAWLVGDAWRCGSMHARFGRHSMAAAFMEVGKSTILQHQLLP
jgi:hypothetical protein